MGHGDLSVKGSSFQKYGACFMMLGACPDDGNQQLNRFFYRL
jgi:hypothetical protein